DFVLALLWEGVADQRSTTGADREPVRAVLLCDVRLDADGVAAWRPPYAADRQPADLLGRGDVAIEQCRREFPHRDIVEPVAGLIRRQQERRVDLDRQEIADRVLILSTVQPPNRVGAAGIGSLGGGAIEGGFEV